MMRTLCLGTCRELSLAANSSGRMLASGSKHNAARVWAPHNTGLGWGCVATCEGYAESIGTVVFERDEVPRFLFLDGECRA